MICNTIPSGVSALRKTRCDSVFVAGNNITTNNLKKPPYPSSDFLSFAARLSRLEIQAVYLGKHPL